MTKHKTLGQVLNRYILESSCGDGTFTKKCKTLHRGWKNKNLNDKEITVGLKDNK